MRPVSLRQLELPFAVPQRLALIRALRRPKSAVARLQKQQARLLRQVEERQAELARAERLVREVLEAARAKIEPLYEQMQGLLKELRQLLLELLIAPQLSRQKRAAAHTLFVKLFDELPDFEDLDAENDAEAQAAADFRAEAFDGDSPDDIADEDEVTNKADVTDDRARPESVPGSEASVGQAPPVAPAAGGLEGQDASAELRTLFRKLAAANHPDHTTDESERRRRTRVMKELTLAYEAGDLAALLRLDAQQRQGKGIDNEHAQSEWLRELRSNVRQLKQQLATLTTRLSEVTEEQAELPSFRRSSTGEIAVTDPVELELNREVANLSALRDFVQRFADGKISLKAFLSRVG
jgi:predicted  nucleic acid-binding Zn-ribbon protein